jgi:hypothetical protein
VRVRGNRLGLGFAESVPPLLVFAYSFWFSEVRYVNLDLDFPYFWPISIAVTTMAAIWLLRHWRRGRLGARLLLLIFALVIGELPWRLNSYSMLDGLWASLGLYTTDGQKLVAGFCVDSSFYLLGITVLASAFEVSRLYRGLNHAP